MTDHYTRMVFSFSEKLGEDITHATRVLDTEQAGDLREVLDAFAEFLRVAGFSYVAAVGVETENGNIIFGDE